MLSFDEAIALTLDQARPLGIEAVPLDRAAGRTLATPVIAQADAPQTSVSTMDGYAVREIDLSGAAQALNIVGEAFPGRAFAGAVGSNGCVRIFTGAPMPKGCDRVVIQELVRREGDRALFDGPLSPGRNVRVAGSDFRTGEILVAPGQRLSAQALVAAAAADVERLDVFRRPRVTVLATGDELVAPGQARAHPGSIPDSGSLGVAVLGACWGADGVERRRLRDDRPSLERAATEALEACDLVVVIGGASVGEKDFAKAMFEPSGLELVFSKVAIKPGKPVWLGRARGKLVLGLPGNPGSAMVTARLFLAPLLTGLGGRRPTEALAWTSTPLAAPLVATGDRETFHRARSGEDGATPLENQDSGAQKALACADLLIRRLASAPAARAGEHVQAIAL